MMSPNTANAAAEAIRRGHRAGMGTPAMPGTHDDDDACEELARRVQAEGRVPTDQDGHLTPLEMAVNLAARVQAYAEALNDPDPDRRLQATIAQAGERAHAGAQLAAHLAQVSMAQDFRRIVNVMLGHSPEDAQAPIKAWARGEEPWGRGAATWLAPDEEGAVDDARATREHMRAWGQGEQTHPGEGTDPSEDL